MALTVAAMCGSLRSASFNQSLLDAFVARSAGVFEVTQVPIREFPHFNQDLESAPFPAPVVEAKRAVAAAPSSVRPHEMLWAATRQRRDLTAEQAREEILREVVSITSVRGRTPGLLYKLSGLYGDLAMPDQRAAVQAELRRDYPRSFEVETLDSIRGLAASASHFDAALLDQAMAAGWGKQDFAALYRVVEKLSGGHVV